LGCGRSRQQVLGACAATPYLKAPASPGPGNSWLVFERELDDALDVSAKAGDEVRACLDENKIRIFGTDGRQSYRLWRKSYRQARLGLAMGTAHATKSFLCVHSADKQA